MKKLSESYLKNVSANTPIRSPSPDLVSSNKMRATLSPSDY